VDGYFARHRVKPGITGWAQINGWRGETDNDEKIQRRVEHDLYYIENWSVLFDLYILAMTPFSLLKTENAYYRMIPKSGNRFLGHDQPRKNAPGAPQLASITRAPTIAPPRLNRSIERMRGALLWLTGFAGAIVFMEPSPYEVPSLLTIFVFVCTGLTLRPGILPLFVLLLLYNTGFSLAVLPITHQSTPITSPAHSSSLSLTTPSLSHTPP